MSSSRLSFSQLPHLPDEDCVVSVPVSSDSPNPNADPNLCLVGRLLTPRPVNAMAFKSIIVKLWQPDEGVYITELEPSKFLFQFFLQSDMEKALRGIPWTFAKTLLLLKKVKPGQSPKSMELNETSVWIRVHDIPFGYENEDVFKTIGDHVGKYEEVDGRNLSGFWNNYVRMRVTLDVHKPLKRGMQLRVLSGQICWVYFKYERIILFCYACGILGHGHNVCPRGLHPSPTDTMFPYSPWLRATNPGNGGLDGERWLRSKSVPKSQWHTSGPTTNSETFRVNASANLTERPLQLPGSCLLM